jgi:uncharacterized damage-inducible protein DinB
MADFHFRGDLAAFSSEVRQSSVKRFQKVHPEHYQWRPRPDVLSFVDILQHLVDADRWLFELLDGKTVSSGVDISPGGGNPQEWDGRLQELIQLGTERCRRIGEFAEQDFSQRQFDLGNRGRFSLGHLILRCILDHEIHHRGALQLLLRLLYG